VDRQRNFPRHMAVRVRLSLAKIHNAFEMKNMWRGSVTLLHGQELTASFLRIGSAGCIIVTIGLPDPDQLFAHPYISTPHVPRSSPKENLRAPKTTLDRVQALFSIRGTRRIAPFSTCMRFWRDTTVKKSMAAMASRWLLRRREPLC
jgi:hypothetical protein